MRHVLNLTTIKHTLAGSSILYRTTAVASMALAFAATDARANPTGGQVVSGNVTITTPSTTETVVTSTTNKSIINWQNFDIMQGETTRFVQPGANSVSLNRVVAGQNASQILGTLTSNGRIVLVNPNGVFFGAGSKVDVAGLVASSANISDKNFLAGKMRFDQAGKADASIVNHGSITATDGGLVALVAPGVENHGVIQANAGTIELASGSTIAVDMYGDNLYSFAVGKADEVGAKGVTNTGVLKANAGTINLTANVAKNIVTNVVNNTGIIEASSASVKGGTVIIGGGEGDVHLAGSINASGVSGGGKVKVTGNNITVAQGAKIDVRATGKGNAGSAIIFADNATDFNGTIVATAVNGNGGFVETSGKYLNLYGDVDASATGGAAGQWLLDPLNITISNSPSVFTSTSGNAADSSVKPNFFAANVNAGSLSAALQGGTNVTVTTQGTTGPQQGDIFVLNTINWSSAASLTLDAVHDIFVGASINSTFAGIGGNINLLAGNNIQVGTDGRNGTNGTNGTNAIGIIPGFNGIRGLDGLNGLDGSLSTAGGAINLMAANDITLGGKAGIAGNGGNGGNGANTVNLGFTTVKGGNGGNGASGGYGGKAGKASITSGSGVITLDAGRDVTIGNSSGGIGGKNGNGGSNGTGAKPGIGGNPALGGFGGTPAGGVAITSTSGDVNINGVRNILFDKSTVTSAGKLTIDPANLNLFAGSVLTAGSHDITVNNINIGAGSSIKATTGDLDIHNTGIFTSANGDVLNAANGHVYLNQNAGGLIGSAIYAIGAYGTDAKVSLGNATFGEQVNIGSLSNFTLTSIDPLNKATIAAPFYPMATSFTTDSGAEIKAVVSVSDSTNVTISDLIIDGVNSNDMNNRLTGVAFNKASGQITGNTIKNMQGNPANGVQGGYGVYAYGNNYTLDGTVNRVEVDNNDISTFQKNGVVVNGNFIIGDVHHNTITGNGAVDYIAQNGVVFQSGAEGRIHDNTISGIGYTPNSYIASDILLFQAGAGVEVDNNLIDGAGYASGVNVYQSAASRIHDNLINNTQNGIELDGNSVAYVENNRISGTTNVGIWAYDSDLADKSLGIHLSGNTINTTGSTGILLEDTYNSSVTGNWVGYTKTFGEHVVGAANNINGDGIKFSNVHDSVIDANHVTNTTTTGNDIGSGIYVLNSHDVTIGGGLASDGNSISNSEWDNIKLNFSKDITVSNNVVTGADRVGIWGFFVDGLTIDHNSVTDADSTLSNVGGIAIMSSNDVNIHHNTVSDVQTGPGIQLTNLSGTNTVDSNTVFDVKGNGIEAIDTAGLTISNNDVSTTGQNGIFVDPSHYAQVTGNTIHDTGNHGIFILDSYYATVSGNYVGYYKDEEGNRQVASEGNINGDGIRLDNSDFSVVKQNTITETASKASDIGSGIYVLNSHDVTVGGGSDSDANFVSNVAWDDVKLGSSQNITVSHNNLASADRVGIWAFLSDGLVIDHNIISGTGTTLVNTGAITLMTSSNSDVNNNRISDITTGHGIQLLNVSGTNSVNDNRIRDISMHGIDLNGVTNLTVTGNSIRRVGVDGIHGFNLTRSGDEEGAAGVTNISNNTIRNFGHDGINLDTVENAYVVGNDISIGGHDGINTTNLFVNGYVAAPEETSEGGDSSEGGVMGLLALVADTAIKSVIADNDIYKVDHDGIHLVLTQNALVDDNHVVRVGHDGIYLNNNTTTKEARIEKLPPVDTDSPTGGDEILLKSFLIEAASAGTGRYDNAVISGNRVRQTGNDGIHVVSSNGVTVTDNGVSLAGQNLTEEGDRGAAIEVAYSDDATISGNRARRSPIGILLNGSQDATVTGNTVRDNGIGISVENISDRANLSGDVFTGNTLGINLDNSWNVGISGETLNIPTSGTGLRITNDSRDAVVSNTAFNGGEIAILINGGAFFGDDSSEGGESSKASLLSTTPDGSSMSFGDTLSTFVGNNFYFVLENGAMQGSVLDASQQTFDGTRAVDFTEDQLADAEGRFGYDPRTVDVADDSNVGDVFYKLFPVVVATPTAFDDGVLDDFQNNRRNAYKRGNFSYAGRAINLVTDPIEPGSLDLNNMNLSLLNTASPTAAADIANVFANLAPAAGGKNSGKPSTAADFAALAPAAGGPISGPTGRVGGNCGNSFLGDGYATGFSCTAQ